jgi:hypothetical protein
VIPPGQGYAAEQSTGFFGRVGAALSLPEQLLRIGAPFGWRHLAHRVTRNGALVLGELQDAMQDRPAGEQGLAANHAGELGLPAAHLGRADPLDGSVAEPGPDMTP